RQQTTRLRPASAWYEPRIDHVDVEGEIDGLRAPPGDLQGLLRDSLHAFALDVPDGEDSRAALAAHLHTGARRLPAADPDLDQVGGRRVRNVRSVEPRGRVHPLVQVGLLGIDVAVEVDDPDGPIDVGRQAAHRCEHSGI